VAKRTFIVILNEVKDLASSGAEKMLDASLSPDCVKTLNHGFSI